MSDASSVPAGTGKRNLAFFAPQGVYWSMHVRIQTHLATHREEFEQGKDLLFLLDNFLKMRTIDFSDIESIRFRPDLQAAHSLHTQEAIALAQGSAMARLLTDNRIVK